MCLPCTVSHNTHQVGLVISQSFTELVGCCYVAIIVGHIAFASVTISSSVSLSLALQISLIDMAAALGHIVRTPEHAIAVGEGDEQVLPESVKAEFLSFLTSVDAPEVRPFELLCSVALAFLANGVGSKLEMVGVERTDLNTSTLRLVLHVHSAFA